MGDFLFVNSNVKHRIERTGCTGAISLQGPPSLNDEIRYQFSFKAGSFNDGNLISNSEK